LIKEGKNLVLIYFFSEKVVYFPENIWFCKDMKSIENMVLSRIYGHHQQHKYFLDPYSHTSNTLTPMKASDFLLFFGYPIELQSGYRSLYHRLYHRIGGNYGGGDRIPSVFSTYIAIIINSQNTQILVYDSMKISLNVLYIPFYHVIS